MELIIVLGSAGLAIAIWAAIFPKAGYPRWWAVLIIIPIANLVVLIILAAQEWPIHREMRDLRIRCGCGTEDDGQSLLKEGFRLERDGELEEALLKYQVVATSLKDTVAGQDAEISIETLRAELREESGGEV